MAKYGYQFSSSDPLKKADGRSHNAGVRSFENVFDLTVDGGTAQPLKVAEIGPGVHVHSLFIDTDQNLSGLNFTLGTASAPAKYGASTAGPNATQKIVYAPLSTMLNCTDLVEEVWLTPSGNMPNAGTLRVRLNATSR